MGPDPRKYERGRRATNTVCFFITVVWLELSPTGDSKDTVLNMLWNCPPRGQPAPRSRMGVHFPVFPTFLGKGSGSMRSLRQNVTGAASGHQNGKPVSVGRAQQCPQHLVTCEETEAWRY